MTRGFNPSTLWIENAAEPLERGMSGSPILAPDGSAIGVVSVAGGRPGVPHHDGGPNPMLAACLARMAPT